MARKRNRLPIVLVNLSGLRARTGSRQNLHAFRRIIQTSALPAECRKSATSCEVRQVPGFYVYTTGFILPRWSQFTIDAHQRRFNFCQYYQLWICLSPAEKLDQHCLIVADGQTPLDPSRRE
ncbi:unnamed protein product, partial [Dicrocoelium dendriticum]